MDQQRSGWGAKFAAVFETIGLETTRDVCEATDEEVEELELKLAQVGAGSFHLRQIRDAHWFGGCNENFCENISRKGSKIK